MEEAAALFSTGELFLVSVKKAAEGLPDARRRIGGDDLGEFTAMLSSLLASGLELKDALEIESSIAREGSGLKDLAACVLRSVEKGMSLSRTLEERGERFPRFYLGMIRIGERVGSLGRVLPRLSSYLAERKAIREKAASALAYPALVLFVSALGVAGMQAFVMPRLLGIFASLGGAAAEQAKRSAAAMGTASWAIGASCAVLCAAALFVVRLRAKGGESARRIDALGIELPLIGRFLSAYESLDFAFAMETLVGGGVPVEAGLGEAAEALGNAAYRKAVAECREAVRKGESLSTAAARRREIPERVSRWISVGERSGQVERVFEQLRRHYQGEVERMSSRFAALLEPALILFVGAAMALFILVFVLPLFSIYGAIL